MFQEAAILARSAAELARRNGWPTGLLDAVNAALEDADPAGPDFLAGQGDRWASVLEALATVQEARPADAARLDPLVRVAAQGAGIADSVATQAGDAALAYYGGVADDVRTIGATGAEVATQASKALPYVLVAAAVGVGWYYLAGPGRGRA
jgi:hypothetical protein